MPALPAVLDDDAWAILYAAFAKSEYRQVIEQLCASGNSPIKASKLFEGLNVEQGREVVNVMLARRNLPYRLNPTDDRQQGEDPALAIYLQ